MDRFSSHKFFKIGQRVWHKEHQQGVVLGVNGMGEDAVVTVSFKNGKLIKIVGRFTHVSSFLMVLLRRFHCSRAAFSYQLFRFLVTLEKLPKVRY